jgi:hypothetical protein
VDLLNVRIPPPPWWSVMNILLIWWTSLPAVEESIKNEGLPEPYVYNRIAFRVTYEKITKRHWRLSGRNVTNLSHQNTLISTDVWLPDSLISCRYIHTSYTQDYPPHREPNSNGIISDDDVSRGVKCSAWLIITIYITAYLVQCIF